MFTMDIVLLTGGEGYIGENLKRALETRNIDYRSFDLENGHDILDVEDLSRSMRKVSRCIHLAAFGDILDCERAPAKAVETNIIGTYNIATTAHKYGVKLVFASSFAVEHPDNRDSVYGLSKAIGERIVSYYGGVLCRLSNVYGGIKFTDLKKSVVARLMKGTYEDRGHGAEERDFIHVREVSDRLIEALKAQPNKVSGEVLRICSGQVLSIDEIVELSKKPGFPDNIGGL